MNILWVKSTSESSVSALAFNQSRAPRARGTINGPQSPQWEWIRCLCSLLFVNGPQNRQVWSIYASVCFDRLFQFFDCVFLLVLDCKLVLARQRRGNDGQRRNGCAVSFLKCAFPPYGCVQKRYRRETVEVRRRFLPDLADADAGRAERRTERVSPQSWRRPRNLPTREHLQRLELTKCCCLTNLRGF